MSIYAPPYRPVLRPPLEPELTVLCDEGDRVVAEQRVGPPGDREVMAYLHPADVHAGRGPEIVAKRQAVLDAAYAAHPERFPRGRPTAAAPPAEAWINMPAIQAMT